MRSFFILEKNFHSISRTNISRRKEKKKICDVKNIRFRRISMARFIIKILDAVEHFLTVVADWFYEE